MLAARVEPKNRHKFKPLILGQYQTAADMEEAAHEFVAAQSAGSLSAGLAFLVLDGDCLAGSNGTLGWYA
jgi:hypothetical protein